MPTTTQTPHGSPGGNTTEALIMMAEGTQLPSRGSRTQSRRRQGMVGMNLMEHVLFERPDDGDEFDEPNVDTSG